MNSPRYLFWLILGAVSPLVAQEPAPSPATASVNPATVPTPRVPWLDQHEKLKATAIETRPNLVFLGDSITAGWNQSGSGIWRERYAPYLAVNLAIAGDTTQNVLWRLENGEMGGVVQPKLVVLMIGTNNGGTAAEVAEGIAAVVAKIRELCPQTKVLLLDVLPRSEKPDHPMRQKIKEINERIAKLDDGQKVFFLPIGDKFLEPDGTISAKIMPGFLHPAGPGYQIWADAMDAKLKELMQ